MHGHTHSDDTDCNTCFLTAEFNRSHNQKHRSHGKHTQNCSNLLGIGPECALSVSVYSPCRPCPFSPCSVYLSLSLLLSLCLSLLRQLSSSPFHCPPPFFLIFLPSPPHSTYRRNVRAGSMWNCGIRNAILASFAKQCNRCAGPCNVLAAASSDVCGRPRRGRRNVNVVPVWFRVPRHGKKELLHVEASETQCAVGPSNLTYRMRLPCLRHEQHL